MKNILRENMRRFGTKNLLIEQSYSPIANYTESVEKIRAAVLKILEFTSSASRDRNIEKLIAGQIDGINYTTRTLLDTMKRGDIPQPRYFEKFKDAVNLRQFYNYVKTRKLFGQDGNQRLGRVCQSIMSPGIKLLKHIISSIEKGTEAAKNTGQIGRTINQDAMSQPGIKIPGDLESAFRLKQSYEYMQSSLKGKDEQLIDELDKGIDIMNEILPTILVKR